MERILVTGAAGYIGSHVVNVLLDMGYAVVAADLDLENVDDRAEKCSCNIFNEEDLYVKFGEPDVLIHMAWRNGFVHNAESHILDLPMHYMFIKQMVDSGVKRVSVMGSMHEIGYYEGAIDENTPQNPSSLYGISKNALRQSLIALSKTTPFQLNWLRGFYIMGDDKRNHSIFAKILQKAEEGEKTFPFTTGVNQYDFIDVDELSLEIALASVQTEITGIINCCSGKPVALKDKVEDFISRHGLEMTLRYGAFPDRPYDSKIIYGDNARIRKIAESYAATHSGNVAEAAKKLLHKLA